MLKAWQCMCWSQCGLGACSRLHDSACAEAAAGLGARLRQDGRACVGAVAGLGAWLSVLHGGRLQFAFSAGKQQKNARLIADHLHACIVQSCHGIVCPFAFAIISPAHSNILRFMFHSSMLAAWCAPCNVHANESTCSHAVLPPDWPMPPCPISLFLCSLPAYFFAHHCICVTGADLALLVRSANLGQAAWDAILILFTCFLTCAHWCCRRAGAGRCLPHAYGVRGCQGAQPEVRGAHAAVQVGPACALLLCVCVCVCFFRISLLRCAPAKHALSSLHVNLAECWNVVLICGIVMPGCEHCYQCKGQAVLSFQVGALPYDLAFRCLFWIPSGVAQLLTSF